MEFIEEHTERQLITDLKELWINSGTSRCVLLKFSQINFNKPNWLQIFYEEIRTYFEDDVDTVYRCHDNDIFFTSRTFTQKKLDNFLTHLKHKLSSAPLHGLAVIFEVRVDWSRLRTICERKLENEAILRSKNQKEQENKIEKIDKEEALNIISSEMIGSIVSRRESRKQNLVMVVEDDPFTQKLIENTIKGNYELSITGDGQGAIMNYVKKAPDMLFLDIGLPDIDGLTVLEKIFQIDPKAYVVMFSGNGDRNNVLKAIELGAKGFLGKPFTKENLFKYIEKSPFVKRKKLLGAV